MAILATVRGLAIAASFFTAGSLANSSLVALPSILSIAEQATATAQTLAQQFNIGYRLEKTTQLPAQLFATAAFGYLALKTRDLDGSSWKFYSAAAAAMFAVFPWQFFVMTEYSEKIVSLAEPNNNHADDTEPRLEHGRLSAPRSARPSITPIEEFEPYEDSPFSGAEYEKMKVTKLLRSWNTCNVVRIISTALAGALALGAVTTRVTLVTIVQGR